MEKFEQPILKFGGTDCSEQIRNIYDHCKSNDGGELASYIPQLTRDAKKHKRAVTLLSYENALQQFICHFAHNPQFSSQIAQIPAHMI